MLCQKFHGFLYQIKTPLNSVEFNFSSLLFRGTFLMAVINKTPNKYKIVEIGIRIKCLNHSNHVKTN